MNFRQFKGSKRIIEFSKYLNNMPIYVKSLEIYDTCYVLADCFYNKYRKDMFFELCEVDGFPAKAKQISSLIEGQERVERYLTPTTDVVVFTFYEIRNVVEDMLQELEFLIDNLEKEDEAYVLQLIQELNEFRYLFIDWLKSYSHHSAKIDRWGFTNPLKRISEIKPNDDDEFHYGSPFIK